jgi:hypothetical protein
MKRVGLLIRTSLRGGRFGANLHSKLLTSKLRSFWTDTTFNNSKSLFLKGSSGVFIWLFQKKTSTGSCQISPSIITRPRVQSLSHRSSLTKPLQLPLLTPHHLPWLPSTLTKPLSKDPNTWESPPIISTKTQQAPPHLRTPFLLSTSMSDNYHLQPPSTGETIPPFQGLF